MSRIARIFQRNFLSFSYLHANFSGPTKSEPKSPSVVPVTPTLVDLVGCLSVLDEYSH